MFTIAFILSLITLVISVPIFLVFGLGSSLAAIGGLNLPWSVLIQVSFGALTKHVLIAVPLFIFAGMAMLKGGAASRLVKFTTTLVGHWPGGLGVAMVIAMGFFAAFCGSILAAITAVGTIMMPKMIEQGYPKPFVVVLAASAALGGIYAGILTPSESAAIAGVYAVLIGFLIYRELTLPSLLSCFKETAIITAVIFSIIATATFLSVVLTYTQAPQKIITYFTEMGISVNLFWVMLGIICLILGTFIEIVPVFYLTVPIFAAITLSFNQSLLHLYVVFVAFAGIGMITPPVCVGIYTAASVIKENPANAFKEVPLFTIVGIIYGILMILFPIFSTWLPSII